MTKPDRISARGKHINWKDPVAAKAFRAEYNRTYRAAHYQPRKGTHRLKDGREVPLDVIAKELGLTPERIRQIEKEALRKLRIALEARGVTEPMVPRGETNWERLESCGEGE
jgi:hypothetical protein